ncbi:MAG: hypothetical protein ACYC6Y_23740 [Thermoguttaceae bacterium]
MRRQILGICALVLLACAVAFRIWPPESDAMNSMLNGACTRVGILCLVVWLAYRDLERLPPWIGSVLLVSVAIVAIRPRWAFILIPLVVALMMLGRKKKPSPRAG